MVTDLEIVTGCNDLGRAFYAMMGNRVRDDYRFYEATHPLEVLCWNMAVESYRRLRDTEVDDALSNLDE